MKSIKTFLLAGLSMIAFTAFAQDEEVEKDLNTLQFVDAQGNVVADGATLTIDTPTDPNEPQLEFNSGLFVQNTTAESVWGAAHFSVESISNGTLQCCFPFNCYATSEVGEITTTPTDAITANEKHPFNTEWLANDYGSCTATFQLQLYDEVMVPGSFVTSKELRANGPKVTINFVYNDPASINGVSNENGAKAVAYYNAAGQQIDNLQKGLNFIKYSNGKTVKSVIR